MTEKLRFTLNLDAKKKGPFDGSSSSEDDSSSDDDDGVGMFSILHNDKGTPEVQRRRNNFATDDSIEIVDFHDSRCTTSLLVVVTTVLTLYNIALVIAMLCLGVVHFNRYTYWNYFGQAFFYFVLWIAIVFKSSYLFTILTLYALPVVFGSVFFVQFFIILVLQLDNGELFASATTLDGGTASVGTVHTFDYVVHTSPVISLMALLVSGYLVEVRATVDAVQKKLGERGERIMFFVHYLATPFLPLTLYCSIFNPFHEYPTHASPWLVFFIALLVFILLLTWFWKIVTTSRGVVTAGHFKVS